MILAATLLHLYPGLDLHAAVVLHDDGDGIVYIAQWHDPRPQPTPAELEAAWPEARRAQIIAAIDAHANGLRETMTVGVTSAEMAAWAIKRAEALAYAGDPTACPMLAAEAAARGVPLAAIIERVLRNAALLAAAEATIAGVAGRHKDAVRAAVDPAGYDWSQGWPL
ncbi:MAG: XkdW family protein [Pseudomonadota bacterium]|nr:XkdW family protein [Pseudomonadota bacterium]